MATLAIRYSDTELSVLAPRVGGYNRWSFTLPAGIVQSGRVTDGERLSQIIKQAMIMAQPQPIEAHRAIVGLPEEQAFLKVIEMPKALHGKELRSALEFQWTKLFPIASDQVYYDHVVVREPKEDKKATTQKVLIVAYPKEIVLGAVNTLRRLGISPVKLVPISFGAAALYSQPNGEGTMVIQSNAGTEVAAAVVARGVTLFSTAIHARVDSPSAIKQLTNIKSFYEKTISHDTLRITKLIILPSPFAPILQQQLSTLGLPTEIAYVKHQESTDNWPDDISYYLPLIGLLQSKPRLTILPTELLDELTAVRQRDVFRAVLLYIVTTLGIMFYFSLVFWTSLQSNVKNKFQFDPQYVDQISQEAQQVGTQVKQLNQTIITLEKAGAKQTNIHQDVQAVYAAAESGGIRITQLALQNDGVSYTVEGVRDNRESLNRFTEALKASPHFQKATVSVNPASYQSEGQSSFSLTIQGEAPISPVAPSVGTPPQEGAL